jgi:hypothetical protein
VKTGMGNNSSTKRLYAFFILVFAIFGLSFLFFFYTVQQSKSHDYWELTVPDNLMEPTLKSGDVIVVLRWYEAWNRGPSEIVASSYPDGDVVVFYTCTSANGMHRVSRVVEKFQENGTWYFITKGDASESYDPWSPIRGIVIVGKVIAVNSVLPTYVPWFTFSLFASTISGICLCLLIVYILHKERHT